MDILFIALFFYALISPKKGKSDWLAVGAIIFCYILHWRFGMYQQTQYVNALILLVVFLWYGVIRAIEDEPLEKRSSSK